MIQICKRLFLHDFLQYSKMLWTFSERHNMEFVFLVCQKQKYAPSVFEKYTTTISLGGKEIKLNLYDTAGKTAYPKPTPPVIHCFGKRIWLYIDLEKYIYIYFFYVSV